MLAALLLVPGTGAVAEGSLYSDTTGRGLGVCWYVLARLITQTASFALVLAAAEDVPDQALAAEERLGRQWEAMGGSGAVVEGPEASFDQGEASADPVAVAAVDELVGAAGEAAFRCILPGGEPGDEAGEVEVSGGRQLVQLGSREVYAEVEDAFPLLKPGFAGIAFSEPGTYFGMMRRGSSSTARHPRAQKA